MYRKNITKVEAKSRGRRAISLTLVLSFLLSACAQQAGTSAVLDGSSDGEDIVVTTAVENQLAIEGLGELGANVLQSVEATTREDAEDIASINLVPGDQNTIVYELQERLMALGFMDADEPTTYYGEATSEAIKRFQRQKELEQDGITGVSTWDALMDANAPQYAVKLGFSGSDIEQLQYRLYNLGYLTESSQISGTFDEATEEAVKKMQQVNGLSEDGTVGVRTNDLLYSEDVKANILSLGEQSEIVKKYQQRLIDLGYLTGEADGNFGLSTQAAIRSFQSRNDLIVDGYLGAETRTVMDSDTALPYSLRLGDENSDVKELQQLLIKYGYLQQYWDTGYYGETTQTAVKSFQSRNGLSADGKAGIQTLAKIKSDSVTRAPSNSSGSSGSSSGSSGRTGGSSGGSSGSSGSSSSSGSASVGSGGATVSGSAGNLVSIASSKLGSPYVWGAKGPNSFDCSGFVYWCLNQAGVGVSYLTSSGWRNPGRFQRVSYGELQAGDIIVVSGHVGIVAGGGTVIDASSSNGRVVHRGLSSWWANNFIAGWRIFG